MDKISLLICSNHPSQWNENISLNPIDSHSLENLTTFSIGENPTCYTIRIKPNFTQYTLVYNGKYVRGYQQNRDGALKVSIAIPKGYKLCSIDRQYDAEISPLNLLIDIQNILENEALDKIIGSDRFMFKENFPDKSIFENVLNKYKLVRADMPHRPMTMESNQIAMIIADDTKTECLFRDVQYPEFKQFKEIAVVKSGASGNNILSVEIPRNPKYDIYIVNENNSRVDITPQLNQRGYNYNYDVPIKIDPIDLNRLNRSAYESTPIEFTVRKAEGLSATNRSFKVDKANEIIYVQLPEVREKVKSVKIELLGCKNEDIYNYLTVKVNDRVHTIKNQKIELIGKEIISPIFTAEIKGSKYMYVGHNYQDFSGKLQVTIREIHQTTPLSGGNTNPESKSNGITKITISLDKKDITDLRDSYRIKFTNESYVSVDNYKFKQEDAKSEKCSTTIEIPTSKINSSCEISFIIDNVKYNLHKNISSSSSSNIEINSGYFVKKKLTWMDSHPKLIKNGIWGIILIILMGLTSLVSIKLYQNQEKSTDAEDTEEVVNPDETDTSEEKDPIAKQLEEYQLMLEKEDVTFEEINEMRIWAVQYAGNMAGIQDTLNAYCDIIRTINANNPPLTAGELRIAFENRKDLIKPVHAEIIRQVFEIDGKGVDVKQDEAINARLKEDRKNGTQYKAFCDLPSAKDAVEIIKNVVEKTIPRNSKSQPEKTKSKSGEETEDVRWD